MTTHFENKPVRAKKSLPTNCPHWGVGGSYLRDPSTGTRTPVDANGNLILANGAAPSASASTPAAGKVANSNKGN